jgi:signal transduction histidine kinase
LFAGFSILGFVIFISVVVLVINGLGIIHIPVVFFQGLLPVAGIFLSLMIFMIIFAGTNLRRISVPLDDLLIAANKVAEGDYSTRIEEKGPPEVLSLTKAFNSMATRLQVNDEQRRALLADVSHELRTPLTIIQGNLEGVLDGMYQADDQKMRSILEETRVLSRLVDDLKTLSLAESGTLKLTREPIELTALVREILNGYQSQANNAAVMIDLSSTDSNITSDVDPERIRQVLSNLISNALRYTPRNGLVRIGLIKNPMILDQCIQISVSDNGPGIASEDLPHIFERYYKSNDSHGMGLGLSIAKYIIEAHGGEIKASSEVGKGTTISFSLPC